MFQVLSKFNPKQDEVKMKKFNLNILYRQMVLIFTCLTFLCVGSAWASDFNWRKYEGTTIRGMFSKSAFSAIVKKHIKQFEKLTGITVKAEYYPSAPIRRKLVMELGARNKDLDVFGGLMKTAYQYDTAGWLEPLDKYVNNPALTHPDYDFDDFSPRTRPIIKGRLIAIGGSGNPQFLTYRKDLFQKYNIQVPTTWSELEAAAKILKKNLPKGQFAWVARMNKENTAPFGSFLYSNNGSWLDKNGKPNFNNRQSVEALEFYGKMAREYGPPGAANIGWKEVVGAMAQGKAAMTVEISIFATLVWENPKRSKVAGKLGYALTPAGPSGSSKIVLPINVTHISALSQKKEAAWFLVQYLTMKEQLMDNKLKGAITLRGSNWQDPRWKAIDKLPELSKLQAEAMKIGKVGYEIAISRFTEARPILQRVLYTAYEGGDVQKKADEAVREIKKLITE